MLQQATTRPRVTVVGSGGLLSDQLKYWPVPASSTYLLGVNASVPLYEGRRNRELVNLSRQQTQTGRQTYQQALQIAQREAETAIDNLTLLRQQLTAQEQVLTTGSHDRTLRARPHDVSGGARYPTYYSLRRAITGPV